MTYPAFRWQIVEPLFEVPLFGALHLEYLRQTAVLLPYVDFADFIVCGGKINVVCLALEGKALCQHFLVQQFKRTVCKQRLLNFQEKLRDLQRFNILPELRIYPKCFHFIPHLPRKIVHHRIIAGLLNCVCICLFDLCGSVQHGVGFRGDFRRFCLFSAPFQLCVNRFIVQPCKIVLCAFRFGSSLRVGQRDLLCCLFGNLRFCRLSNPIVLIAETCAV